MAKRLQELQSHPLVGNVPETAIMLIKDNTTAPYYEDYKITFQDFTSKLIRQVEASQEPLVNQIPRLIEGAGGVPALPAISAEYLINLVESIPVGTDTVYGKLKLSASTSSTLGVNDGTAATPSAVKTAYDAAAKKASNETISGTWTFTGAPTISNNLIVKHPTDATALTLDCISGKVVNIIFKNAGLNRWKLVKDAASESGSNAGSNLVLVSYADDGSSTSQVFSVSRANQVIDFNKIPTTSAAQGSGANEFTRKDYVNAEDAKKVSTTGNALITGGDRFEFKKQSNFSGLRLLSTDSESIYYFTNDSNFAVCGLGTNTSTGVTSFTKNNPTTGVYEYSWLQFDPAAATGGEVKLANPKSMHPQGTAVDSITRKDYVDGQISTRAPSAHSHSGDSLTPISIGGGKDLNTYQTPGVYFQDADADAASGLNYPEAKSGALHVYKAAGVVQVYHVYGGYSCSYRRTFYGNTWSAWAKVYDTANKPTAADVGAIPVQNETTVIEAGRYIDMKHVAGADYNNRLESTNEGMRFFTANSNLVMGCRNTSYAHFDTAATTGFYFYKLIDAQDVLVRSDRRLKSNFKEITNPLHKVCSLNGRIYNKKLSLTSEDIGDVEAGVIAQEVEAVLPEAVKTNKEEGDLKSVSPSAMIALLVEAVKELKAELDELKSQV